MKGEWSEHNKGPSSDPKEKPSKAWGCFEGGIGGPPVPSGEKKEKESGGKRVGAPKE